MITKSLKVDVTRTTNLVAKLNPKNNHYHITKMGIKTINNAGLDSNARMICLRIGEELNFIQNLHMIESYFTALITANTVDMTETLVAQARGIHFMIMKSHLNSKLMVAKMIILDLNFCLLANKISIFSNYLTLNKDLDSFVLDLFL